MIIHVRLILVVHHQEERPVLIAIRSFYQVQVQSTNQVKGKDRETKEEKRRGGGGEEEDARYHSKIHSDFSKSQ